MFYRTFIVCLSFLTFLTNHAFTTTLESQRCPNILSIGPEFYHVKRTREGGSKQTGFLYGGRICFDYIKRYSFYWGAEGAYAKGMLKGKSGSGSSLKCHDREAELEGRFGYTFQRKRGYLLGITPFAAYGVFQEKNNFLHHHPFRVKFENSFKYVGGGFLSQATLFPGLIVGINFKAIYMVQSKSKVTEPGDEHVSFSIDMENKMQYLVELPIKYTFCVPNYTWEASFVPFYRYRHYGGKFGYPFDFLETKFQIYGARLTLNYHF